MSRLRIWLLVGVAAAATTAGLLLAAGPARTAETGPPVAPGTRSVLFVANNWDGTADIVDPETFEKLGRFNVVPDLQERLLEIYTNPVRLGYFTGIRALVGEGHDQYADDMFSSHDGRVVYISRPSLADVVAIDLKTNAILWRFVVDGQRSDHMAISPDGSRVLVSASTGNVVHEIDTATGKEVGRFPSGDSPHENNYSADGRTIFHASIGLVYTPADQPFADSTKGKRYFQVVEAGTNKILKQLEIGKIMADNGYPGYSSAVRPMAISPDEKLVYMQLSFLHGFVVFDLEKEKPIRVVDLPLAGDSLILPREAYLLDSAHHGLAISPDGSKLCAAGTMSDYAAIVSTSDFSFTTVRDIEKPYWSTNSADGKYCFLSASGNDEVVVISYATGQEIQRIPVGDHPQRMRMGVIRSEYVGGEGRKNVGARPKRVANLQIVRARVSGGRIVLGLKTRRGATGRLRVRYQVGESRTSFRTRIARSGEWTVRRPLRSRRLRRAPTGVVQVDYAGDRRHTRDSARVRTGRLAPRLAVARAAIDPGGRLALSGSVDRRARGRVRVRVAYVGSGSRVRYLRYSTRIRGGRWQVRALLPSQARDGADLAIQYRGYPRRRIAGQQIVRRLRR